MDERATKQGWRGGGEITVLEDGKDAMDAELWGRLGDHIPLLTVYEKLPLEDRLRLCVVCKAWYHSALQRLEPKPYFGTTAVWCSGRDSCVVYLNGLLKYDAASEECVFEHQPFSLYQKAYRHLEMISWVRPLVVEGLILCRQRDDGVGQLGVYSIHTKMWHAVLPAPEPSEASTVRGMMVDTSERPYAFKLVVGSVDKKTQIYDSRSRVWSTTSSILFESRIDSLDDLRVLRSCMCHDGRVYMSMGYCAEQILVYSMKEDNWKTLDSPVASWDFHHTMLGVWKGRIFTTRDDFENHRIVVWELVDLEKQEWAEYGRSSVDEYNRLLLREPDDGCDFIEFLNDVKLVSVFCDEYLLLYYWMENEAQAFSMFNLKTKMWTPIELPKGTMSFWDREMDLVDYDRNKFVDKRKRFVDMLENINVLVGEDIL